MSALPRYTPAVASESSWRRSLFVITMLLTALGAAIAVMSISATQLTERATAQPLLAAATSSLLEIDRFVANAWPALEQAAERGEPIELSGFPVGLQLDPAAVADGPEAVAREVVSATASLVYDDGFDVLAQSPQAFRFLSRGAAFDGSVGRLTRGGHSVATIALIVSGTLTVLLAMSVAAQVRGLTRFGAPALGLGVGAAIVWIAGWLLQSSFTGRAESSLDPFSADLWWIAVDAVDMLARNAAIVALASGAVAASAVLGGLLLRAADRPARS